MRIFHRASAAKNVLCHNPNLGKLLPKSFFSFFSQAFEEDVKKLRSPAFCISNENIAGSCVKSVYRLKTSFLQPYENFTVDLFLTVSFLN